MDHLCYFRLVLLCFHGRLFVDALWSPAGKGLTSWLSLRNEFNFWKVHGIMNTSGLCKVNVKPEES